MAFQLKRKGEYSKQILWGVIGFCLVRLLHVSAALDPKDFPNLDENNSLKHPWRLHTLFSVECHVYFDWQTVGMMHSYRKNGQPGPITRLLSCTDEQLESYRGFDLAPTHLVPSMSKHPVTGDWYILFLSLSLYRSLHNIYVHRPLLIR